MKVKSKRKIPSLNIISNGNPIEEDILNNVPEFKKAIYLEVINAVREGISKNKQTLELFEINNSGNFIEIEKKDWVHCVKQSLKYFEKNEEYEKCSECLELINKL